MHAAGKHLTKTRFIVALSFQKAEVKTAHCADNITTVGFEELFSFEGMCMFIIPKI